LTADDVNPGPAGWRWLPRLAVFAGAYALCVLAYAPIVRFPMLGNNDLGINPEAASASWGKLLRGLVVWHSGDPGRQFRPLPVLSFRLDDFFVGSLGPGHRWFDFAALALLALACFWLLQRLAGPLTRFETVVCGLLCAAVPASFAGSDSGVATSSRADTFVALFVVILVGALATLLPVRSDRPRPRSPRAAALALGVLAVAVLGCSLSKEYGTMISVVTVVGWAAAAFALDRTTRSFAATTVGVCLAVVVVFYVYKAANGGFHEFLLPSRLKSSDTPWGVPGVDTLIAHTGSVGQRVGDAVRNIIATPLPAFTDYGHVVARRIPFLLPFVVLAAAVAWSLVTQKERRPLVFLLAVAAIVSSVGLYSLRPRIVLPGTALWFVAVCLAIVFLLRSGAVGPRLVAGTVVVVAAVSLAFGYSEASEASRDYYGLLFSQNTSQFATARPLAAQQAHYQCDFLASYESLARGSSVPERISLVVSGLRLHRPAPSAARLVQLRRKCGA
jgi:hypothetical protein